MWAMHPQSDSSEPRQKVMNWLQGPQHMRRFLIVLLIFPLALEAQVKVEVRNSEVWLVRNGAETQLTHDGKAKYQAELSPVGDQIAYFEACPMDEHCIPSVVILDLEGRRLTSLQVRLGSADSPCYQIVSIAWVAKGIVAAVCHLNPSLNEYVETDLATGRTSRDLLGYWFEPSPDGKWVAHVGGIPHFAPPFAQSNYLQIDDTTIYPLAKGMKPVVQKAGEPPPDVVREEGLIYLGIHEFLEGPMWSPDSKRIALIDCTYDWIANSITSSSEGDGKESNRHCSIAVVSPTGKAALFPLGGTDMASFEWKWVTPRQLSVRIGNETKTLTMP
jgi:hypothetical protein